MRSMIQYDALFNFTVVKEGILIIYDSSNLYKQLYLLQAKQISFGQDTESELQPMINKNPDNSFSKGEFLLQNIDRYESYPAILVHAFQIFNQKYRHFEPISITPKSKLVIDKNYYPGALGQ